MSNSAPAAAGSIISHGEEFHKVAWLDDLGRPTAFTEEIKMGVIKFDNGSRILAFSSNPQAMSVYAGDVGLDEFAKHPNPHLLWETAQGRVTWGYDMSVWSSHDGEDTLFYEFAQQARATAAANLAAILALPELPQTQSLHHSTTPSAPSTIHDSPLTPSDTPSLPSQLPVCASPWNLYYRVTMTDAIELGLLDVINRVQRTLFTPLQFIADCKARALREEIFQQSYMCNPKGAETHHIVEWSVIEQCRFDYEILRLHLEHAQILEQFGAFNAADEMERYHQIREFINKRFLKLFQTKGTYRLGFDVAASGQGDLAVIYIDERKGEELWLRALFSCRTEDWHFLETVLFKFMRELHSVTGAGDASGLGRQICWEANSYFGSNFIPVTFSSKKHDLGFALMNQLASARKRFPRSEQDIAADFFALRKTYEGSTWNFSEGPNTLNPASHCDIAWAGALATHAHLERKATLTAYLG